MFPKTGFSDFVHLSFVQKVDKLDNPSGENKIESKIN